MREGLALGVEQPASCGVGWVSGASVVLEVGEAVEELAAEEVEVAVAVEVGQVGAGPAEDVDRLAAGSSFTGSA